MNPQQSLMRVSVAIDERPNSNAKLFAVIVRSRRIICVPKNKVNKADWFITQVQACTATAGFSQHRWRFIEKRIESFQKAGVL